MGYGYAIVSVICTVLPAGHGDNAVPKAFWKSWVSREDCEAFWKASLSILSALKTFAAGYSEKGETSTSPVGISWL